VEPTRGTNGAHQVVDDGAGCRNRAGVLGRHLGALRVGCGGGGGGGGFAAVFWWCGGGVWVGGCVGAGGMGGGGMEGGFEGSGGALEV